jgi:hypothetical protein
VAQGETKKKKGANPIKWLIALSLPFCNMDMLINSMTFRCRQVLIATLSATLEMVQTKTEYQYYILLLLFTTVVQGETNKVIGLNKSTACVV